MFAPEENVVLVRCPQCREANRLSDVEPHRRVVSYLCPTCESIVRIDLILDEVRSTGASVSFKNVRRSPSILVADDSAGSGEVIAGILRDDGYQVRVVHDGDSALESIRQHHPDLAVIDLMLPGLSSFDILRAVQADARLAGIPVMVVGSVLKPDIVHFLNELGAAGFVDRERVVDSLGFRVRSVLAASPVPDGRRGIET